MKNLLDKVLGAIATENAKFIQGIRNFKPEVKTTNPEEIKKDMLSKWFYRQLLPKGKDMSRYDLKQLKEYLIERSTKKTEKQIAEKRAKMQRIMEAKAVKSIVISVEWKPSRMWGSNPKAEAKVCFEDGYCELFNSGSIGGCGYDKLSTAVAEVLRQIDGITKLMYAIRNKNTKKELRDLFGYGAGYGLLPRIEGGVGVNCYPRIMEKIGFTFKTTASGKSFDVFTIEKKR